MFVALASINDGDESGALAPLVGEGGASRVNRGCAMGLLGLLLGDEPSSSSTVYDSLSLLGDWTGVYPRPGELPGVLERPCGGELGVEGRRKGEGRGEPNDNGDGLKGALEETCKYGGERSAEGGNWEDEYLPCWIKQCGE